VMTPIVGRSLSARQRARRKARLVSLVELLPEGQGVGEQHLSLQVRGRRFGWLLDDHHGDGRLALNCRAERGAANRLAVSAPAWFQVPTYLGHRGWIGVWLDLPSIDWASVYRLIADAYVMTAPKRLLADLASTTSTRKKR
jgi:hypothetical protein